MKNLMTMAVCAALTATGALAAADASDDHRAMHLWKICTYEGPDGDSDLVLFWERATTAKIIFGFETPNPSRMTFIGDTPYVRANKTSRTEVFHDGHHLTFRNIDVDFTNTGNLKSVRETVVEGYVVCD